MSPIESFDEMSCKLFETWIHVEAHLFLYDVSRYCYHVVHLSCTQQIVGCHQAQLAAYEKAGEELAKLKAEKLRIPAVWWRSCGESHGQQSQTHTIYRKSMELKPSNKKLGVIVRWGELFVCKVHQVVAARMVSPMKVDKKVSPRVPGFMFWSQHVKHRKSLVAMWFTGMFMYFCS